MKPKDASAHFAIAEAKRGAFERLIKRTKLSAAERKLLADLLEGKVKPRRLKNGRTVSDQWDILSWVFLYQTVTRKLGLAIDIVCKQEHVSRRYIFKLLKETDPELVADIRSTSEEMAQDDLSRSTLLSALKNES